MTHAGAMSEVVAVSAPAMKAAGFRKRRHAFNREADDGLVHHLSFQMGSFDPPGTVEIPGLRTNLYGKFTINLGVYVPSMRRMQAAKDGWINDYNCNLRYRLGELLPERTDVWWNLEHSDAGPDAAQAITDHALPWLDSITSHAEVLSIYEQYGVEKLGMNASGTLDIADLYLALGQRASAHAALSQYVQRRLARHHVPYVETYLVERGLDELVPALHLHNPPATR